LHYPFFDTGKLRFRGEGGRGERISYFIASKIYPRLATGRSPVVSTEKNKTSNLIIESIWKVSDFADGRIAQTLPYHIARVKLYNLAILVPYFIISLAATAVVVVITSRLLIFSRPLINAGLRPEGAAYPQYLLTGLYIAVFNIVMFIYILVVASIALRIAFTLANKSFADTLCAVTITYLLIDLYRDDVLADTAKRKELILRMDDLARNTRLLALRYFSKSVANQEWAREHFMQMEQYIRARERWVVAPLTTTLGDLRRDFSYLAPIYFTGNYGEFVWAAAPAREEAAASRRQRLLSAVPRMLAVILPLGVLGLLVWQQGRLEPLGINVSIIILILAAWALISIDSALKLGVVSGAINLAKEIRSLK
jgi:hypothetical protein